MSKIIFKEVALVLVSLSLILVFGCSENSSITQPLDEINPTETTNTLAEPNSFGLPNPVFKSLQNSFSVKKILAADRNSSIRIKKDYESELGMCKVDVNVAVSKGSISEDTEITMTLNTENGEIAFSPQLNLKKDALIEIKYINVDLSGSREYELDFVYMSPHGYYKPINRQSIKKKIEKGELTMKQGVLPHLSSCFYVAREYKSGS